ncbi:MAG: recombinase family protein [Eubacteriales bacterium]|nr:recombinase family protein [Eubacteriales bacterium]
MDAIYTRQSVDKKDSISIETQIELCKREVAGNSYKIYQDKGYSGSNINRPDFQAMIRDIKNGLIHRVIVYRLDRMSRSLLDFANLIDLLDRYHTSFVSTQEKFDTGTPMGRAMLSIAMVFAQLERETIQIRIKDNYYARGEKGMYLGGPPPYGFQKAETRKDGKRFKYLEPIDTEAEVIRQMYEMYGNALYTLGEVARVCNHNGYLTHSRKEWSSSKVGVLLKNPIYVRSDIRIYQYYKEKGCQITSEPDLFVGTNGCYLYGKRKGNERKYSTFSEHVLSLAPSEGFVDAELFLKCQHRLEGNIQVDNSSWGQLTWLTGLVKCAHCGYAAVPKSSNGGRYYYLYCSGRAMHCCDVATNLGKPKEVETAVEQRMFTIVRKYESIPVEQHKKISMEANRLKAQIQNCRNQMDKLIDMALDSDDVVGTYLKERIEELDKCKTKLEARLAEAEAGDTVVTEKQMTSFLQDWPTLDVRHKNELARMFIDHIDVSKEEITIFWKYHFGAEEMTC